MKLSEGTPQQQADMRAYRAHAKKIYTEQYPCCLSFEAEVELLEAMLRKHWTREEARAMMAFLVNSSWDFYSPYDYIKEWTLKAIEAIKGGMTFAEVEATGLLSSEGSLFPVDNLSPDQKMRHELMAFDEELKAGPPVKFKDRIRGIQKDAKWTHRSDN